VKSLCGAKKAKVQYFPFHYPAKSHGRMENIGVTKSNLTSCAKAISKLINRTSANTLV